MSNGTLGRREFVATCASACVGMLAAGCVSMVTHPVPIAGGIIRIPLADFPELSQPQGAIRIQPAGMDDALYVVADDAGSYRALSSVCTHRGCTVDVKGPRLVCPCHGSTYDRTGLVLRGPAERALESFPLTRRGDELFIEVRS